MQKQPKILEQHTLKLRYDGGLAKNGELDLYDGTASIHGFAQALQIATHAYINNEVVSRATALKNAKMHIRTFRPGSFLVEIVTFIEAYPAISGVAATISAPVFYDFIKTAFQMATGKHDVAPMTPHVRKRFERDEPFFDDLGEALEGSLQRGHRPIGDTVDHIFIEKPRGPLLSFDKDTKDWVNTREEVPGAEKLIGNVTRFNSITRNGRAFIDKIGRIVPFKPDGDFPGNSLQFLTWSLHGSNMDISKKLNIYARRVKSAKGETKRLLLLDCERSKDQG